MKRYWNSWNATKAVLRGKFIEIYPYMRKEKSHINKFSFHFKKPGKEEQTKCIVSIIKKGQSEKP